MRSNSKLTRIKQQRIRKQINKVDSHSFFNLLTSEELLDQIDELLPEHRERIYPPTETLSLFLTQVLNEDSSCQNVVNKAALDRLRVGLSAASLSTGGYCKARQRLPLELVSELTRKTGELVGNNLPDLWKWKGKRVKLIDGTTVNMPDTPDNQRFFPQQGAQKEGLGFPICRIVGVLCLSTGVVLDAAIGRFNGKGSSEQTLLRNLLEGFGQEDLIIGDAFYATYFLLAHLIQNNIDAVFERYGSRKRVADFRKGKKLGSKDHLITLTKPKAKPSWMAQSEYDAAPESLVIRELKVSHKVLITTMLSTKDADKVELKALYKQRWHVELDFRNIKTTLGMEHLSCKTAEMNQKEIWVYLLAHNLIRILMAQAAILSDLMPRQLSFKHSLQIWLAWSQHHNYGEFEEQQTELFLLIAGKRVGNRPGRVEPRAVKQRPKPFSLLMIPREQAREKIRKNGHPKKLK